MSRKHESDWLFSTFLIPSDDPALYPYVTYDNALVWRVFVLMQEWRDRKLFNFDPQLKSWLECAEAVRSAVMKHLVIEADGRKQFAFSTDLMGNHELYEDPPGSLQLLVYYKFSSADDEIYRNTIDWIYSTRNRYYFGSARLQGVGCQHHPGHPALLSLCADLLGVRAEQAAHILAEAPLDNTIACESYSAESGIVKTGAHFATCAGLLTYAIHYNWGRKNFNHEEDPDFNHEEDEEHEDF